MAINRVIIEGNLTRKRALQIGFLSLLAVMFLLASFLG